MKYPFVIFCKNPEVHSPPSCYLSSLSLFFFSLFITLALSSSLDLALAFCLAIPSSFSLDLPLAPPSFSLPFFSSHPSPLFSYPTLPPNLPFLSTPTLLLSQCAACPLVSPSSPPTMRSCREGASTSPAWQWVRPCPTSSGCWATRT